MVDIVRNIKSSPRGELEITDVKKMYSDQGQLSATMVMVTLGLILEHTQSFGGRQFYWYFAETPRFNGRLS